MRRPSVSVIPDGCRLDRRKVSKRRASRNANYARGRRDPRDVRCGRSPTRTGRGTASSRNRRRTALIPVGHEPMDPGPAYKRYTGKVIALGDPDGEGHIYSFEAMPIGPGIVQAVANEMKG